MKKKKISYKGEEFCIVIYPTESTKYRVIWVQDNLEKETDFKIEWNKIDMMSILKLHALRIYNGKELGAYKHPWMQVDFIPARSNFLTMVLARETDWSKAVLLELPEETNL